MGVLMLILIGVDVRVVVVIQGRGFLAVSAGRRGHGRGNWVVVCHDCRLSQCMYQRWLLRCGVAVVQGEEVRGGPLTDDTAGRRGRDSRPSNPPAVE